MTRNLYLGADLTPGDRPRPRQANSSRPTAASSARSKRPTSRSARGAWRRRSSQNEPDLVGLQEVALWREAPPSVGPILDRQAGGDQVRYDFLELLLKQLNRKKQLYRAVVVQDEFDFEAPADANGIPGDGPGGGTGLLANTEVNGRLTMRDVILERLRAGVVTRNPQERQLRHLLVVKVAGGTEVSVTRGWTSVDAKVRGSKKFRFVNTHLEAFDDEVGVPEHPRPAGGRAGRARAARRRASCRSILLGDFNSDVKTEVKPGDGQAYRVLKRAGFRERRNRQAERAAASSSYDLQDRHRARSSTTRSTT